MAKEHAEAVRKSDLYEYKGISKSLLERIAYLIVGTRKEDERGHPIGDPKPNEGFCTASQEVLAAMHGCSEREVGRQVDKFVEDGWLTRHEYRNEAGHRHYKYSMTPKQLKKIEDRKMKKYPEGHEFAGDYIRASNPKMKRSFTKNPHDKVSGSLPTTSRQAPTTACTKPHDSLSTDGSSTWVALPSSVEKMGCLEAKATPTSKPSDSFSNKEGMEKQPQPPERQGNPIPVGNKKTVREVPPAPHFLDAAAAAKLVAFGCPEGLVDDISRLSGWSKALNNTTNVISSYETMAMKDNGTAKRFYAAWMPKRISEWRGGLDGDDAEYISQDERESLLKEHAKPKAQKLLESALRWWNDNYSFIVCDSDCDRVDKEASLARRKKHIDFAGTDHKVVTNQQIIVAAYEKDIADRRRAEYEELVRKCAEVKAKRAAA